MSSFRKRNIVYFASVGEPPPPRKKIRFMESLRFTIYNFKEKESGKWIKSPTAEAHGHRWQFRVKKNSIQGDMPLCELILFPASNNEETECFAARVFKKETSTEFRRVPLSKKLVFRILPNTLTNLLKDDGSFVIEFDIKVNAKKWYPMAIRKEEALVELYQDASSATSDIVFSVGEATYRAHKCILALYCKKLYELASECSTETPIPIQSVRKEIFKALLDFVYTTETEPKTENMDHAKELLVAADRFECVDLKLQTESILVNNFLCSENAVELYIFAESHVCALLKEEAAKLIVGSFEIARKSEAWYKIKESKELLEDLLSTSLYPIDERERPFDSMTVTCLRENLESNNLDFDGSREVLVERLKKHCEK